MEWTGNLCHCKIIELKAAPSAVVSQTGTRWVVWYLAAVISQPFFSKYQIKL